MLPVAGCCRVIGIARTISPFKRFSFSVRFGLIGTVTHEFPLVGFLRLAPSELRLYRPSVA